MPSRRASRKAKGPQERAAEAPPSLSPPGVPGGKGAPGGERAGHYVLDSSVFLLDPEAGEACPGSDLTIPLAVLEELDRFKGEGSELGRNARAFALFLDGFCQRGELARGVPRPQGGILRVDTQGAEGQVPELEGQRVANRVLATALRLAKKGPITLISQDTSLRVRANALGIPAQAYQPEPGEREFYQGFSRVQLPQGQWEQWVREGRGSRDATLLPNAGVLAVSRESGEMRCFRHDPAKDLLRICAEAKAWNLGARNPQQTLALDLLLDPALPIVTLAGKAGTGKTLLAIAAGLEMMLETSCYTKVLISRPIFPMGKDLGYLPGTAEEKLSPWMQPIFDNLDFLLNAAAPGKGAPRRKSYQSLLEEGLLTIEPLTYIRGRSIPRQFMVVDEAQNLTPHEIKTIITRVGEGTKIVLTGDLHQIDNPYMDAATCGLNYAVDRLKNQSLAGHVTLVKGERSPLAEMATNIL